MKSANENRCDCSSNVNNGFLKDLWFVLLSTNKAGFQLKKGLYFPIDCKYLHLSALPNFYNVNLQIFFELRFDLGFQSPNYD